MPYGALRKDFGAADSAERASGSANAQSDAREAAPAAPTPFTVVFEIAQALAEADDQAVAVTEGRRQ